MKKFSLILVLCLALSPVSLAEPSSADRFLSSLSDTWDAFLDMTEDAGKGVVQWAEDSGVAEWAEGAVNDVSAWFRENGLTDWARDTLDSLKTWFDESGIAEWAEGTSEEIQAFIEKNRPVIEAWLTEAGQEVRKAWDVLIHADRHTKEEVEAARGIVEESLQEAAD